MDHTTIEMEVKIKINDLLLLAIHRYQSQEYERNLPLAALQGVGAGEDGDGGAFLESAALPTGTRSCYNSKSTTGSPAYSKTFSIQARGAEVGGHARDLQVLGLVRSQKDSTRELPANIEGIGRLSFICSILNPAKAMPVYRCTHPFPRIIL